MENARVLLGCSYLVSLMNCSLTVGHLVLFFQMKLSLFTSGHLLQQYMLFLYCTFISVYYFLALPYPWYVWANAGCARFHLYGPIGWWSLWNSWAQGDRWCLDCYSPKALGGLLLYIWSVCLSSHHLADWEILNLWSILKRVYLSLCLLTVLTIYIIALLINFFILCLCLHSLSANGKRTLFVDLDCDNLKPEGWDSLGNEKPNLLSMSDISIYELHIRDFRSISFN